MSAEAGGAAATDAGVAPQKRVFIPFAPNPEVRERMISFSAPDGQVLEGRLTVPMTDRKSPVVFFLGGSGPNFTHWPVAVPGQPGKYYDYTQFYSGQLARRGIAFFRMSKRGCGFEPDDGGVRCEVRREVFSKTTLEVLLADYRAALSTLREQPEIDPTRIILLGISEGTILGPRLAVGQTGVRGIAMVGYVDDGYEDVLEYTYTTGRWRGLKRRFDRDGDDVITRQEYDESAPRSREAVPAVVLWFLMDKDKDGRATREEVVTWGRDHYDEKAFADPDHVWETHANLNPELLKREWRTAPRHRTLLAVDADVALGIFHGTLDEAAAVEGVKRAQAAFRAAHRENLRVKLYEGRGHDLGFDDFLRGGALPQGHADLFDFIAEVSGQRAGGG